ncbi:hypothetical protein TUM4438_01790 [Shewanella sairae]|uniref:Transmembrane anchor protein n=1 Tax=Shewanella sairae TaxID=190310 RepID=A0ABQ4NZG4_9GAMM|nr:hypothetical protein [Shewanella sairae]MCL1129182.1 hypothetical protein [Shewanella sairae]GIU40491.1 hypothetical protein TUM4438_01790 [Shewanella sairae]
MKNINNQSNHHEQNTIPVHSNATLLKASLCAGIIGAIVLVTAILPAEYNIDPTGIGKAMGLTKIAEAAQADPSPISLVSAENPTPSANTLAIDLAPTVSEIKQARAQEPGMRQDKVDIVIPAGKGLEYKFLLNQGKHLEYDWRTDGGELFFDFHGEPQGDSTGFYESFAITTASKMRGTLTTPFSGSHGWYWKNKTNQPITVTLSTKGAYLIKG